jgi:hypothetical protein
MNINEYVKGKRYNDLSTDGYDWTKWCADNNADLERRIAAAGLQNCERNGRILLEYISENNFACHDGRAVRRADGRPI